MECGFVCVTQYSAGFLQPVPLKAVVGYHDLVFLLLSRALKPHHVLAEEGCSLVMSAWR